MEKKKQLIFLEDSKGIIKTIDRIGNLYVISDEQIQEGDWYYNFYAKDIRQSNGSILFHHCKKIIVTTDELLIKNMQDFNGVREINFDILVPKIPQSFIEHFVSEYNKGNIITEVMVEYEPKRWINNPKLTKEQDEQDFDLIKSTEDYDKYLNYGLKINPDNTINIKPIKDSWSKKEQFEQKVGRVNRKQFKQFDEYLFKAYLNKFSEEDKLNALKILFWSLNSEQQFHVVEIGIDKI